MSDNASQRTYRAPCPGCGAPVEFRSAQSTHAICAYCHSSVVRDGDTLSRIGKMAEVFEDFSPLQLLASGRFNARSFTIVGRLQYRYREGTWNEWHAVFDDGSSGFLSEDNGAYVFALPANLSRAVPPPESLRVGATTAIDGRAFSVASNAQVSLAAAEGELPRLAPVGTAFAMVELRSTSGVGEVFSIDYSTQPPGLSAGRSVALDELQLSGLREASSKEEKGRQFACPNCGAPVIVTLASSKSISCASCHGIIDLSQGIGGELKAALQDEPVQPLIPLGSQGNLQGTQWQVVGFQHRMGHEPGVGDDLFGWQEYLLYNARRGFTFLVDAEDGWSVVKPTTGAPVLGSNGQSASYLGTRYQLQSSYEAETTYVAGEFYWQVQRGQKTFNRDFASGRNLLSMEQTPQELVWSSGARIDSDRVASAFNVQDKAGLLKRSDAAPGGGLIGVGSVTVVVLVLLVLLLLFGLSRCSRCDPSIENCVSSGSGARSSGGSYGGFSSGGGHK
jgi:ribosomal protein S27E